MRCMRHGTTRRVFDGPRGDLTGTRHPAHRAGAVHPRARTVAGTNDRRQRGRITLWPDTFTNYLSPEVGHAAVRVAAAAGYAVDVPTEPVCCALTWITTGQLDTARRVLRQDPRRAVAGG